MSLPSFSNVEAEKFARLRGSTAKVIVLGFRSATSKFGEYDDTLALLTPDSYTEFKGNTLPSKWEHGVACLEPGDYDWVKGLHGVHHFLDIENALGQAKRIEVENWLNANLAAGKDYPEQLKDSHGNTLIIPYPALRQAGPMMIVRDSITTIPEPDGWPSNPAWIDGHKGGWNGTSSLACQTFHPEIWQQARKLIYEAMDQYTQPKLVYSLHQLKAA